VDEVMALDHPKIRAGLAPYAPYTLSKNLLKIFYQHIKQLQISLQIHASESFAEMEFFYDSKGDIANILFPYIGWGENLPPPHQKTPIQFLNDIEFLQVKPALAGCVHLGPTDLALIANSGSSVIHCPRSNETLNVGRAPLRKILSQKIPVALGSECRACNSNLSIWEEMRAARDLETEGEPLSSEELLKMATWGGARALNLDKEIGSLEKGKWADFLVLEGPSGADLSNVLDRVVREGEGKKVLKRWVGGEEV
jgi:cytosine/adenosine deaminase-related metal-dependent hydrolase